jgi:hypothetical protein
MIFDRNFIDFIALGRPTRNLTEAHVVWKWKADILTCLKLWGICRNSRVTTTAKRGKQARDIGTVVRVGGSARYLSFCTTCWEFSRREVN